MNCLTSANNRIRLPFPAELDVSFSPVIDMTSVARKIYKDVKGRRYGYPKRYRKFPAVYKELERS